MFIKVILEPLNDINTQGLLLTKYERGYSIHMKFCYYILWPKPCNILVKKFEQDPFYEVTHTYKNIQKTTFLLILLFIKNYLSSNY